jgi:large subunit ribosomal protein L21
MTYNGGLFLIDHEMFAVIKTGGKQYQVKLGQFYRFEKLGQEAGQNIEFKEVLLAETDDGQTFLGKPLLEKACVTGTVVREGREKKIQVIKFRRRKNSMTQAGHRQSYTLVKITGLDVGDGKMLTASVEMQDKPKSAAVKEALPKKPAKSDGAKAQKVQSKDKTEVAENKKPAGKAQAAKSPAKKVAAAKPVKKTQEEAAPKAKKPAAKKAAAKDTKKKED